MRHILSASILAIGLTALALPASSLAQPARDHDEGPPMDRHPPPPPHRHHPHHHHYAPPPHRPPPEDYDRHSDHH